MQSAELLAAIAALPARPVRLMEVCGTHTMAIARSGLKGLLPREIALLSGPGCPVCVTPASAIDACLALSERSDVILASYGDMLRVPGSARGDTLLLRRARGAQVRIVYSPLEALELAQAQPGKQIVFIGVGFETTAPGTAAAVEAAREAGVKNFFLLSLLKRVRPALEYLCETPGLRVDGFLCPGHVASVLGAADFSFLAERYGKPAVVAGFEPEEILLGVYRLLLQIEAGEARPENAYPRAVRAHGNPLARAAIERVFAPAASRWRGMGELPQSGLRLRGPYAAFDAAARFNLDINAPEPPSACRCGAVLTGSLAPAQCPLFGVCTPEDPIGPCMVSGEGSCAAAYKYGAF